MDKRSSNRRNTSGLSNSDVENVSKQIFDEIVDELVLGVAFDVHRSVKTGLFAILETESPTKLKSSMEIDSNLNQTNLGKSELCLFFFVKLSYFKLNLQFHMKFRNGRIWPSDHNSIWSSTIEKTTRMYMSKLSKKFSRIQIRTTFRKMYGNGSKFKPFGKSKVSHKWQRQLQRIW